MNRLRDDLLSKAARIVAACSRSGSTVATAESCTGGLIAAFLTEVPGSSAAFERGFVTYSNAAKTDLVGVPATMIEQHGAVSEPVARAMAEGARRAAGTTFAVAVTGVAGPGGGTPAKPVGRVHLAIADVGTTEHAVLDLGSLSREEIRLRTVDAAFDLLLAAAVQETAAGTP
jgi:nicotinamide-nucleotide amidase